MRYTLICSASGTALSPSIKKLVSGRDPESNLRVEDVERNLCLSSRLWELEDLTDVPRSMKHVCLKLPRAAISVYWRKALKDSLKALSEASHCALALACHLTLYTPNRQELFVPGRPQDFLNAGNGPAHEVIRVVVLIDDIYDMYARLSSPKDVYHEEQHIRNYKDWVEEFPDQSPLDPRFMVRLRSLESLAAWRRAELVQAEALANALGNVPLTVLGVKHYLAALNSLLLRPEMPVAYLSHKIGEARRFNKKNPGDWPPFVSEVNSLSLPFQESGIVRFIQQPLTN